MLNSFLMISSVCKAVLPQHVIYPDNQKTDSGMCRTRTHGIQCHSTPFSLFSFVIYITLSAIQKYHARSWRNSNQVYSATETFVTSKYISVCSYSMEAESCISYNSSIEVVSCYFSSELLLFYQTKAKENVLYSLLSI